MSASTERATLLQTVKRATIMLQTVLGLIPRASHRSWRNSLPPPEPDEKPRYEELLRATDEVATLIRSADDRLLHQLAELVHLRNIELGIKPGEWFQQNYLTDIRETRDRRHGHHKENEFRV
jgi:hypothetical protein